MNNCSAELQSRGGKYKERQLKLAHIKAPQVATRRKGKATRRIVLIENANGSDSISLNIQEVHVATFINNFL